MINRHSSANPPAPGRRPYLLSREPTPAVRDELREHHIGEALDQIGAVELRETALDPEADGQIDAGLRLCVERFFAIHRVAEFGFEGGVAAGVRGHGRR